MIVAVENLPEKNYVFFKAMWVRKPLKHQSFFGVIFDWLKKLLL